MGLTLLQECNSTYCWRLSVETRQRLAHGTINICIFPGSKSLQPIDKRGASRGEVGCNGRCLGGCLGCLEPVALQEMWVT